MTTGMPFKPGSRYPELFSALAEPIHKSDIKYRKQSGRELAYITARTVFNRLDSVLGPEGWWDEYIPGENSVMCKLTILLPDGSTLTKVDAGGYAGMADSGDDDKSGFSDAIKRVAFKFGIARELYGDGVANLDNHENAPVPERNPRFENRRETPPQNGHAPRQEERAAPRQDDRNGEPRKYPDRAPTTGRALFAWTKEMEQKHEIGLLKWMNSWAKLQDIEGRIVDWSPEVVALAHGEAIRKIQAIGGPADDGDHGNQGDAYEA